MHSIYILGTVSIFTEISGAEFESDHTEPPQTDFWPPVLLDAINLRIRQMCWGKAPGPDLILTDLLKTNLIWCSNILALLFTQINKTGIMPALWKHAMIILIKKVQEIILLTTSQFIFFSSLGKIYADFFTF